jgi:hypothetical protein
VRPTLLPAVIAAALPVALLAPTTVASPATSSPASTTQAPGGPDALDAPYHEVADDLDLTVVVPALQERFGERYGGYWLEVPGTSGRGSGRPVRNDVMHVGVVGATRADRVAVAQIVGRHPRVVTDAVTHGYNDLLAAEEEVAASLAATPQANFTVETEVASNRVVVRSEGADLGRTKASARDAARRGVAERGRATANKRSPSAPTTAAPGVAARAEDLAEAVEVVPASDVAVELMGSSRRSFPPYEAGLEVGVSYWGVMYRCTSGFLFANGYGLFGSTAGHCGGPRGGVYIGGRGVDSIRLNTYHSDRTVRADVGMYSLSARWWLAHAVIHGNGYHLRVVNKYSNAQLGVGLRLCFEGVSSDSHNCGNIVRANQTICCDGAGHSFVFTCIAFPSIAGDSGGPVYKPSGTIAYAAGMLSALVTINGVRSMCFSTIANIEARTNSRVVLG